MHGVTGFAESAALLVFAAFVLVTICSRIGVPSIVGYILAGIVIGSAGLDLIAENAAFRLRTHSQKSTVAARAMAERKTVGHRS